MEENMHFHETTAWIAIVAFLAVSSLLCGVTSVFSIVQV